ncbi:hypothetical protein SPHINGOAX6_40227 [Sphingomonas sp. AX6]|nr:hypothetical protein SPHINGOAX6_40227 [Sphingomonas sp. AX6]
MRVSVAGRGEGCQWGTSGSIPNIPFVSSEVEKRPHTLSSRFSTALETNGEGGKIGANIGVWVGTVFPSPNPLFC